jgi:hypothetical protein
MPENLGGDKTGFKKQIIVSGYDDGKGLNPPYALR